MNFGDILRTVVLMAATMELAISTLVLQLLAVFDAMPVLSTVEALVASWCRSSSFDLLFLIVP